MWLFGTEQHRRAKHARAQQLKSTRRQSLDGTSGKSNSVDWPQQQQVSGSANPQIRHRSHSAEGANAHLSDSLPGPPPLLLHGSNQYTQRRNSYSQNTKHGRWIEMYKLFLAIVALGAITFTVRLTETNLLNFSPPHEYSFSKSKDHVINLVDDASLVQVCSEDVFGVVHSNLMKANACYAPILQRSVDECSCSKTSSYASFEQTSGESWPSTLDAIIQTTEANDSEVTNELKPTERTAYRIPKLSNNQGLTEEQLKDQVVFVFIHVNKAAGTTIKQSILFRASILNNWDGAGFGTPRGWSGLGAKWSLPILPRRISTKASKLSVVANGSLPFDNLSPNGNPRTYLGPDPLYLRCGKPITGKQLVRPFQRIARCPMRFVWGSNSLGLCEHFGTQPCVYFTVLRHPVSRMISQYNYVCLQGKEAKKKWLPEWKKAGKCTSDIFEFVARNMTSTRFLHERLSQGCGGTCDKATALLNLKNPCMRYILLEDFENGLRSLGEQFGPALRPHFEHAVKGGNVYAHEYPLTAHFAKQLRRKYSQGGVFRMSTSNVANVQPDQEPERSVHNNVAEYDKQSLEYLLSSEVTAKLEEMLKDDMEIYNAAVEGYASQWERPLVSCNNHAA